MTNSRTNLMREDLNIICTTTLIKVDGRNFAEHSVKNLKQESKLIENILLENSLEQGEECKAIYNLPYGKNLFLVWSDIKLDDQGGSRLQVFHVTKNQCIKITGCFFYHKNYNGTIHGIDRAQVCSNGSILVDTGFGSYILNINLTTKDHSFHKLPGSTLKYDWKILDRYLVEKEFSSIRCNVRILPDQYKFFTAHSPPEHAVVRRMSLIRSELNVYDIHNNFVKVATLHPFVQNIDPQKEYSFEEFTYMKKFVSVEAVQLTANNTLFICNNLGLVRTYDLEFNLLIDNKLKHLALTSAMTANRKVKIDAISSIIHVRAFPLSGDRLLICTSDPVKFSLCDSSPETRGGISQVITYDVKDESILSAITINNNDEIFAPLNCIVASPEGNTLYGCVQRRKKQPQGILTIDVQTGVKAIRECTFLPKGDYSSSLGIAGITKEGELIVCYNSYRKSELYADTYIESKLYLTDTYQSLKNVITTNITIGTNFPVNVSHLVGSYYADNDFVSVAACSATFFQRRLSLNFSNEKKEELSPGISVCTPNGVY